MPVTAKLIDVLNMEDGAIIPAVKGKLTELYKQTSGFSKKTKKDWTVQNGEISDGQNTCRFAVWNHDDLSDMKGKEVYFLSVKGKKGGLNGVEFKVGEYKGKPQPEIVVNDAAEITLANAQQTDDGDRSNADLVDQPPPGTKGDTKGAGTPPATTPAAKDPATKTIVTIHDVDLGVRKRALQYANLRLVAERGADYMVATYHAHGGKRKISDDQISVVASGIYIALDKEGAAEKMPAVKIEVPETDKTP